MKRTAWVLTLASLTFASQAAPPAVHPGKKVFDQWCAACHGPSMRLPGTASLAAKYGNTMAAALEERDNLNPAMVRYFVRHGISIMPTFRKTEITDAELDALGAYLARTPAGWRAGTTCGLWLPRRSRGVDLPRGSHQLPNCNFGRQQGRDLPCALERALRASSAVRRRTVGHIPAIRTRLICGASTEAGESGVLHQCAFAQGHPQQVRSAWRSEPQQAGRDRAGELMVMMLELPRHTVVGEPRRSEAVDSAGDEKAAFHWAQLRQP